MGSAFREQLILSVVILVSLGVCATANSCGNSRDTKRCDKVVKGKVRCYLVHKVSINCKDNVPVCLVQQQICLHSDPICTPQCCHGWKEDSSGKCSIPEDSHSNTHYKVTKHKDVSTMITGILVVLLVIILGIMSVGMFRFKRARRNLRRRYNRRTDSTNMNGRSSIYTIYDNEPPPYDIIIQSKLPEYTETDNPPDYLESNANCASAGSNGTLQSSQTDNPPGYYVNNENCASAGITETVQSSQTDNPPGYFVNNENCASSKGIEPAQSTQPRAPSVNSTQLDSRSPVQCDSHLQEKDKSGTGGLNKSDS